MGISSYWLKNWPPSAKMKSAKTYGEKKIQKIDLEKTLHKQSEDFISALKKELPRLEEINAVVLFGSLARGDYSIRHSDIDLLIFIGKEKPDPLLEEKIRTKIIKLSLGKELAPHVLFQYKILEEDQSLLRTIAKEGKVIFVRKAIVISWDLLGLKEYLLIKFDTAGKNPVVKNKLQRLLYGYTIKGKKYNGLVDGEQVISAGKGAVLAAQELAKKIIILSNQIGIQVKQKGKFYK